MAQAPPPVIDHTVDPAVIHRRHVWWRLAAAVLLLVVFWLDSRTPAGVAVPVLYVVPVLIFLWTGRFWESLVTAALSTVLTLAGFSLFKPGPDREIAAVNRGLALTLTWVTAIAVAWYRRAAGHVMSAAADAQLQARESVRRLEEIQRSKGNPRSLRLIDNLQRGEFLSFRVIYREEN